MLTDEEVLNWLSQLFEEAPGQLTPETRRDDISVWDSLGTLKLMAGLDGDFGVQLSDDDIERLSSVGDILDILRRNGKLALPPVCVS